MPSKTKPKMVKCPDCGGRGRKAGGTSVAIREAVRHGYDNSYGCECCGGTGKVPDGTDPDWWKQSDNAPGNGGR